MRRSFLIIALVVVVILFVTSCKKAVTQKQKLTVTLDWTPNTNHAGLYVAKELGYFSEVDLDVEIQQPGQGVTDQIVASGNSDFGISYQENVIRSRSEGIPLVSIAAIIQHNTSGFASLKSSGITSPKDFEGKRYGSWDSPSELSILKSVMQKSKADFKKVTVVSGVYDFFSTIGKEADFEWIYYGWDGVLAKQRGVEINYLPLRDLDPIFDYYTPVIICSENYLSNNPETTKKFMQAVSKGYDYCINEPQKAADILLKHVPELNAEQVKLSMEYLAKEYKADSDKWGYQKSEVWHSFANWMSDNSLIPSSIDIQKAFSNSYLPE